jgi:hypothetical protein
MRKLILSSCAFSHPVVLGYSYFFYNLFQVEFIQKFSPKEAENLPLWQYISFQAFSAELRKQTAHEVTKVGTAQCRKWLGSSRTLEELESLVILIALIHLALFTEHCFR